MNNACCHTHAENMLKNSYVGMWINCISTFECFTLYHRQNHMKLHMQQIDEINIQMQITYIYIFDLLYGEYLFSSCDCYCVFVSCGTQTYRTNHLWFPVENPAYLHKITNTHESFLNSNGWTCHICINHAMAQNHITKNDMKIGNVMSALFFSFTRMVAWLLLTLLKNISNDENW